MATVSVQDEASKEAFDAIGVSVDVDGDPRVERVMTRPANPGEAWKAWASESAQVVVAHLA